MTDDRFPQLLGVALDAPDPRRLAEFYRELFGAHYRPGDEPPVDGTPDDADWLVLLDGQDRRLLAVQAKPELRRSTWPSEDVPMQLHLDVTVTDRDELERQRERAISLGARVLLDRSHDPDEPLYVLADPAGHPFCLFVA